MRKHTKYRQSGGEYYSITIEILCEIIVKLIKSNHHFDILDTTIISPTQRSLGNIGGFSKWNWNSASLNCDLRKENKERKRPHSKMYIEKFLTVALYYNVFFFQLVVARRGQL